MTRRRVRRAASHPSSSSDRGPAGIIRASKRDIEDILTFVGPEAVYGVRRIELRQSDGSWGRGRLPLGRLAVPGRILLYEQPNSPWRVPGKLPRAEVDRLQRAGAEVEEREGLIVTWTASALRDLMLFDALLHEVGHHLVQHHKGKRQIRVARTAAHEAFADLFAWRCRQAWQAARPRGGGSDT